MRVLFYGRLVEAIGPELQIDVPAGCCVAHIRERLAADFPGAASTLANKRALACIAGSFVRDDYLVTGNDVLEFLPPVSGG